MGFLQQSLFQMEQIQSIPFVSTDLRIIELARSKAKKRDIVIEGTTYRKLDAQYFLWIEDRMRLAEKAVQNGKMSEIAFQALNTRFEPIKEWITENLDVQAVATAKKLFKNYGYDPPPAALPKPKEMDKSCGDNDHQPKPSAPYLYPKTGNWEYTVPIDPDVVKIIDSIRDEAMSKGWSEAALYQNRAHFVASKLYGLICMLDKTDVIERIEEDIIYIRTFKGSAIPPEGEVVKFPNLEYEERHAKD